MQMTRKRLRFELLTTVIGSLAFASCTAAIDTTLEKLIELAHRKPDRRAGETRGAQPLKPEWIDVGDRRIEVSGENDEGSWQYRLKSASVRQSIRAAQKQLREMLLDK